MFGLFEVIMTTITFSPFFLLIISICAEVFGTMSLGKSSGFQHIGWGLVALILYGLSFWFLSKVITAMPIAVAYAIWAGKCFDGFVSLDAF